jgi:leader peptidase (prepilin peptidase)/N-methyltransferase
MWCFGVWQVGLVPLFVGVCLGGVVGVGLVVTRRKTFRDYLAFGPFLAAGSVLTLFFGPQLLALVAGG